MMNLLSTSIDLYINKLGYDHFKIYIVISHQSKYSGLLRTVIIECWRGPKRDVGPLESSISPTKIVPVIELS